MGFEPGGLADKLGNRYEGRWVATQLLRLLNEEIRSVTVEAIGDDERGVDLWIEKNEAVPEPHLFELKYHQIEKVECESCSRVLDANERKMCLLNGW